MSSHATEDIKFNIEKSFRRTGKFPEARETGLETIKQRLDRIAGV